MKDVYLLGEFALLANTPPPNMLKRMYLLRLSHDRPIAFLALISSPPFSASAVKNLRTCTKLRNLYFSFGENQYRSLCPFVAPPFLTKTFFTHCVPNELNLTRVPTKGQESCKKSKHLFDEVLLQLQFFLVVKQENRHQDLFQL